MVQLICVSALLLSATVLDASDKSDQCINISYKTEYGKTGTISIHKKGVYADIRTAIYEREYPGLISEYKNIGKNPFEVFPFGLLYQGSLRANDESYDFTNIDSSMAGQNNTIYMGRYRNSNVDLYGNRLPPRILPECACNLNKKMSPVSVNQHDKTKLIFGLDSRILKGMVIGSVGTLFVGGIIWCLLNSKQLKLK